MLQWCSEWARARRPLSASPCSKIEAVKLLASVILAALPPLAAAARPVQEFSTSKGVGTITPIQHATLMIEGGGKLFDDKGGGDGFILTYGGKRFYICGDTEGTPEMRALKDIDVAFVCMNLPYTMPPEEAAEAVRAFKPKVVYPYHYRGSDV